MKPKILLVDDEPNIIHSYSRALRKNWELVTAMSGAEGVEALKNQGPFAVIVSDFNMPRMDGIAFLKKALEMAPETIRMMLTGEGDFQIATKAVNEGNIFRFITKPCPLELLEKALHDANRQYRLLQVEKEAHQQELRFAGEIQQTFLVSDVPSELEGMTVAAVTLPSKEVDGDFIDFYKFSRTRLDIVVGDVMGKGLHAAMVGAGAKNKLNRVLWRALLQQREDSLEPARLMDAANRALAPALEQVQKFITMVYARFDSKNATITFVDAGHPPVLWYSTQERKWHQLKGENMPVGINSGCSCVQNTVGFSSNDIFLFYSDGLLEGKNNAKEAYEDVRLFDCLDTLTDKAPSALIDELVKDFKSFVGTSNLADDLTIVAVKIA